MERLVKIIPDKEFKKMVSLKGKSLRELKDLMISMNQPEYRGGQIHNWMYNQLADDFDSMANLPKALRAELNERFFIDTLSLNEFESSTETGTKKYIFRTKDNHKIESVIIPEGRRTTLCLSTQVGCPLDCKFCATGLMGYTRNLSAGEIFDQYKLTLKENKSKKITNIVYMGMGEPLLNLNETIRSLSIFSGTQDTGISLKKITVSTVGIAPKIKELADTGLKVKLAFSLHSCFEDVRSRIIPINKKYSLKENLKAIKYYSEKTGTKITFEYVMLKDINDRAEDIKALSRLCSSLPSKINLIPFNSLKHMNPSGLSAELVPTPAERIHQFAQRLKDKNVTVMLRNTQGSDIAAACGQLACSHTVSVGKEN